MKLYPHQEEALKLTKNLKRVAYYYDMGLGKTFIGSEKMMEIGNRVNLLICQKSKITDWRIHFETYYPNVFAIDYRKSNLTAEDIVLYSAHSTVVVIVNYELAWRREELARLTEFTLMLDESSMVQNPTAKQTKFIIKKLHEDACILLSGTPCGGKFENLWTQAHLLGVRMTKREFENRFVNFETIKGGAGFPIRIVDRNNPYRNVDELKDTLKENGAIFMKTEEVMTLPEQRFINVFSPISSDYRKFKKERVLETKDREFVGSTSFSYRLGLRMLASGYSSQKLEAFRDLISSTSDRLIVFYNFNHELEALRKMAQAENRPISVMSGDIKDLTAYEKEDNSITFCQYQAGAMGLNLQKANKMLYFSLPERSELFEQSKKRIHRIGQKNVCTYYVMQTASSIDQLIYRALERKQDYTDELFRKELDY